MHFSRGNACKYEVWQNINQQSNSCIFQEGEKLANMKSGRLLRKISRSVIKFITNDVKPAVARSADYNKNSKKSNIRPKSMEKMMHSEGTRAILLSSIVPAMKMRHAQDKSCTTTSCKKQPASEWEPTPSDAIWSVSRPD